MTTKTSTILNDKATAALTGIARGIEKEGLRYTKDGLISQSPHPKSLGSTLTHPYITTDYSEALLEFITPKQESIEGSLKCLSDLHAFTLAKLPDEKVWPASMPCRINGAKSIPIAQYGSSNVGVIKNIYRRGLDVRYGRIMQAIAGIHYNVSLPKDFWLAYQEQLNDTKSERDFRSEQYFHLIRNFHRHSWVLYYLFGASPVLDSSFFGDRTPKLEQYGKNTWGLPYATSLRMSDLGYTNSAQQDLHIGYDSLKDYIATLSNAVQKSYPAYEKIGVKDSNGNYQQLNANILQIENEYYSEIRPKRVADSGERPVNALARGGVEYIEVRALDINPFLPVGIDATESRFLDAFVLHCLLTHSAAQCPNEWAEIAENRSVIINRGREPGLKLKYCGTQKTVVDWVDHILDGTEKCAHYLDQAHGGTQYADAVNAQRDKAKDPANTPSGRVMAEIESGREFYDLINDLAEQHTESLLKGGLSAERQELFDSAAATSVQEQADREAADEAPFDEFLADYNQL